MEYMLKELDDLIERIQLELEKGEPHAGDLDRIVSYSIPHQVKSLQQNMRAMVTAAKQEEAARVFVDQHARSISSHCEILYALFRKHGNEINNSPGSVTLLLRKACERLEVLLNFMESQFPKYFQGELPLPFTSFDLHRTRLNLYMKEIIQASKRVRLKTGFVDVIIEPLQDFIADPARCNFRKIGYLYQLCDYIIRAFDIKNSDYEFEIHVLLHSFNFNSPQYLRYCGQQFKAKFGHKNVDELRAKYAEYIKMMNQVPVRIGFALHHDLPPLLKSNTVWFEQEQEYIENLIKINNGYVNGVGKVSQSTARLRLKTNVPTVTAICKSLYDAGKLDVKSQNEAMGICAQIFSTEGAEIISQGSFTSNFFNLKSNSQAVQNGIDFLLDCVKALRAIH